MAFFSLVVSLALLDQATAGAGRCRHAGCGIAPMVRGDHRPDLRSDRRWRCHAAHARGSRLRLRFPQVSRPVRALAGAPRRASTHGSPRRRGAGRLRHLCARGPRLAISSSRALKILTLLAVLGVIAQVTLGIESILSSRDLATMTVHSSLGAALLACLIAMYWLAFAAPAHERPAVGHGHGIGRAGASLNARTLNASQVMVDLLSLTKPRLSSGSALHRGWRDVACAREAVPCASARRLARHRGDGGSGQRA